MPRRQKADDDHANIAIHTDDNNNQFTNHDAVAGQILLTPVRRTESFELHATVEGSSFTCIKNEDGLHTHLGRVMGKHRFLIMPIDVEDLPQSLPPGQTCSLPFRFVMPSHCPHSCNHTIEAAQLEAKLGLMPPSMVLKKIVILEDGVTVDAARINYVIRVILTSRSFELGRATRSLNFVPSAPSLQVEEHVRSCGETVLKSGHVGSQAPGKLVVESDNLPVFHLPHIHDERKDILCKLDLSLRYESISATGVPVEISKVDIRMKTDTFYNARPFRSQPSIPGSTVKGYRYLSETILSSSFALGKISWAEHDPDDPQIMERIRLHPSSVALSPVSSVFTTKIFVPVTIPAADIYTKILPTFDACIISQSCYAELDFQFAHKKLPAVTCKVPVLITTRSSPQGSAQNQVSGYEEDLSRIVSPPEYSEHLLDDLPAYEPADIRLIQNDGRVETFAYVKSEPWLNVHNGFKHGYKKLKGHLAVRQARTARV